MAERTKKQTLAWLRTLTGELSTATLKRLDDTLPWYRDMPPGRRSAVGLVAQTTPLDDYVHEPDAAYRWEEAGVIEGDGFRAHVLDMTSQNWVTPEPADRTLWRHWLVVYQPDTVKSAAASPGSSSARAGAARAMVAARLAARIWRIRKLPG